MNTTDILTVTETDAPADLTRCCLCGQPLPPRGWCDCLLGAGTLAEAQGEFERLWERYAALAAQDPTPPEAWNDIPF